MLLLLHEKIKMLALREVEKAAEQNIKLSKRQLAGRVSTAFRFSHLDADQCIAEMKAGRMKLVWKEDDPPLEVEIAKALAKGSLPFMRLGARAVMHEFGVMGMVYRAPGPGVKLPKKCGVRNLVLAFDEK